METDFNQEMPEAYYVARNNALRSHLAKVEKDIEAAKAKYIATHSRYVGWRNKVNHELRQIVGQLGLPIASLEQWELK